MPPERKAPFRIFAIGIVIGAAVGIWRAASVPSAVEEPDTRVDAATRSSAATVQDGRTRDTVADRAAPRTAVPVAGMSVLTAPEWYVREGRHSEYDPTVDPSLADDATNWPEARVAAARVGGERAAVDGPVVVTPPGDPLVHPPEEYSRNGVLGERGETE